MEQKNSFLLNIDNVFNIHNQGTVVTGRVESGCIKTGDKLKISGAGMEITAVCAKLEKYMQKISMANVGDYIGITLSDMSKTGVSRGMSLTVE